MSALGTPLLLGSEGGYQISRSVRLRSSASGYFNNASTRTITTGAFTFSMWFKRGTLGTIQVPYNVADSSGNSSKFMALTFLADDSLRWYHWSGSDTDAAKSNGVLRDPAAWYHVVLSKPAGGVGTMYLNGVAQTKQTSYANDTDIFATTKFLGRQYDGVRYFDGYIAEVHAIDGQALTPSSFGETDAVTGVWKPKKYAGTYGTNGFYLNFSDNSSRMALGHSETGTHIDIVESDGSNQSIQAGVGACRVSTISTANASYTSAVNEYLVVTPGAAIPVTSSLKIYFDINYAWANGRNLYINGTQVSSGNVTVATVSGMQEWTINFTGHGITSLSSITTPVNTGGRAVFYGISIDGNTVYATANDWTPNNISVTSGVTYDSMLDVPTMWVDGGNGRGNYAVWNPLSSNNYNTATDGNLRMDIPNARSCLSNISMSSGKWYCEVSMAKVSAIVGIAPATVSYTTAGGDSVFTGGGGWGYVSSGVKQSSGTTSSYGASWVANDIIGIAYDADTGSLEFFKNGTSQGVAFTGISVPVVFAAYGGTGTTAGTFAYLNAGQRPFAYTPPTGFKALNTQNLPDATIKKGSSYFNTVLYTGNAGSQSITGVGFQPDLVWGKIRSTSGYHRLHDALRGADNTLSTNVTDAEVSGNGLVSFDADGFTMDSGTNINQAYTYVAWNWKESASAGFDIVTYTGTGTSQNVSHSLGVAPKMMITKKRSTTGNWSVYHANLTSYTYSVYLNATNAQASDPNTRGSAPSSSTFNVGTDTDVNANGATYVAYLFAEVAGFSKMGSYTGNGSADGPFVYLGFRPRWLMVKRTDSAGTGWAIYDTTRDEHNVTQKYLGPEASSAESTIVFADYLSNGFKVRSSLASLNASGGTYIYAAFAENPTKYSLAR